MKYLKRESFGLVQIHCYSRLSIPLKRERETETEAETETETETETEAEGKKVIES